MHHGDTENTEIYILKLRALRVSVVKISASMLNSYLGGVRVQPAPGNALFF
jgi:hypothetical protein